jgi:glycosyltransferase involved in cell wall biosynthesis
VVELVGFMMQAMTSNISGGEQGQTRCPRVSVVLIFLNGEAYLVEAIESVISQTFDDWEFLLVDDGSSDTSTAIAKEYVARYPEKIRYFEHAGHANRGMSATRNLGLANARGEYIGFIDADDVWLPWKLANQVSIMDAKPAVGMVCGSTIYWSSWSGGEDRIVPSGCEQDCVVMPPEATIRFYPLGHGGAPCPSDILLRARLVRDVRGFEEHFSGQNQLYEDQGFLAKVYLRSPIYVSSSTWLKYRLHDKSCVATVKSAGKYHDVRRYFLNWFEGYVASIPNLDERIHVAIRRALRPYRHPNRDFLLSLPKRLLDFSRRASRAVGHRIWRAA